MRIHRLKHLLSETLVLGAVVFPFAMVLAALVGLVTWIVAGFDIAVRATWITWCATIGVVPVVLRIYCGPNTRVICDRCLMASRLNHRDGQSLRKEQRRHARYPVNYPATFSNNRICGFGMITDVSAGGCRVKSKTTVAPGDVGQLLITLPSGFTPLIISQAFVRWVRGNECGLEFVRMDPEAQRWLNRITGQLGVSAGNPLWGRLEME